MEIKCYKSKIKIRIISPEGQTGDKGAPNYTKLRNSYSALACNDEMVSRPDVSLHKLQSDNSSAKEQSASSLQTDQQDNLQQKIPEDVFEVIYKK